MEALSSKHFKQAKRAASELNKALRPLKLLSSVSWDDRYRSEFLQSGRLPNPEYKPIDIQPSLELIASARGRIQGDHIVFKWLERQAGIAETTAYMLSARGTAEFSRHSQALFGTPSKLLLDKKTKVIDLARHVDTTLAGLDISKLVIEGYERNIGAKTFARELRPLLRRHLRSSAPQIKLAPNLNAKAVAGSKTIRIRADARFSGMDIDQLLQHEALVHVATALNGKRQTHFPLLGRPHAGTTQIQEGLAVFAEMISGSMDPVRFRRLADRVFSIDMSLKGADFKEVFDYYAERSKTPEDAFENTRRIFRGGLIGGGAPFTKDLVYLNGLLRVHNFMRSVVKLGRADLIRLVFVGKLDLEDIPALAHLASVGRLDPPKYMPDWAKDLRFLVSYLAYSSFLNQVKMPGFQSYYENALKDVPIVWEFGEASSS